MKSVAERLLEHPYEFDFFQAVRLLEDLDARRKPIGREGPPGQESVRFRVYQTLSFPASSIYSLERLPPVSAKALPPPPVMTATFFGLTGATGALPVHYTQLLLRLMREGKGNEKTALRDWFDLFNHRLISLFYRAWEKYRFAVPYVRYARAQQLAQRGETSLGVSLVLQARRTEPDPFTLSLFNLVGMGTTPLRNRMHVLVRLDEGPDDGFRDPERDLLRIAHVEDLALLHYGGFLIQQPRNVINLEALVSGYFRIPAQASQFTGQWLQIDPARQSRLEDGANNVLEKNVVCGERVWDVVSRFRIRLGPLTYANFVEFLPDRTPQPQRKGFFLLTQLIRIYVGMELDFEVQLVLRGDHVPDCQLKEESYGELGARLGWNTWMPGDEMPDEVDDAYFEGEDVTMLRAG